MDITDIAKQVEKIQDDGCRVGTLHDEQIKAVCKSISEIQITIKEIFDQFKTITKWCMYLAIALVFIAIIAGINVRDIVSNWFMKIP